MATKSSNLILVYLADANMEIEYSCSQNTAGPGLLSSNSKYIPRICNIVSTVREKICVTLRLFWQMLATVSFYLFLVFANNRTEGFITSILLLDPKILSGRHVVETVLQPITSPIKPFKFLSHENKISLMFFSILFVTSSYITHNAHGFSFQNFPWDSFSPQFVI